MCEGGARVIRRAHRLAEKMVFYYGMWGGGVGGVSRHFREWSVFWGALGGGACVVLG